MINNLELFSISDYTDRSSNPVGVNNQKSSKNKQSEYEQIARDLVVKWERMGLDTNDVLLEMKLGEIKKILTHCTRQQQESFGLRLTEWIFFNNGA
jgi:hypothetical protein